MGKRVSPQDKITQRSIGFTYRQISFFDAHPEFKPDIYCRIAIDNQISLLDPKYLPDKKEAKKND